MVSTNVQLCNLALEEIGEDRISDLTDDSKAARACNLILNPTIDEILELYDWSDAVKRAQVSALDVDNYTEYDYVYQLPNDCLRILYLIEVDDDTYTELPEQQYIKEGRRIYTDLSPCVIKYLYRPEVKNMSSGLVKTIKHTLASQLANRLAQDPAMVQYQQALAAAAYQNAILSDGRSKSERPSYSGWEEVGR